MTTTPTPGPWENYHWLIRHPTGGVDEDGVPWTEVVATASNDANARLIAAAPDLLAACEEAERILGNMGYTSDEGEPDECYRQLGAAIAKARG